MFYFMRKRNKHWRNRKIFHWEIISKRTSRLELFMFVSMSTNTCLWSEDRGVRIEIVNPAKHSSKGIYGVVRAAVERKAGAINGFLETRFAVIVFVRVVETCFATVSLEDLGRMADWCSYKHLLTWEQENVPTILSHLGKNYRQSKIWIYNQENKK